MWSFGCGRLFALERAARSAQLDGAQCVEELVEELLVTQFSQITLILQGERVWLENRM